MDSVVEEEAVEGAKQIKEEIEELVEEAVAVELVAPLETVDKVDLLEEDLDLVVEDQVVQVDRHKVTQVVVKVVTLQVDLVVEMELP